MRLANKIQTADSMPKSTAASAMAATHNEDEQQTGRAAFQRRRPGGFQRCIETCNSFVDSGPVDLLITVAFKGYPFSQSLFTISRFGCA
jgi:hypothetical protein